MERSSSSFDGNVNLQIMRNILANEITKVQTRDVLNKISEQKDNENNKHQRNINTNTNTNINMNMNSNTCSNINNNSNNKYTNHTQDTTSILDYSFLNKPTQDVNITSLITNVNTGRNNRSKSNTKMNNHIQFSNNTNNNNYNTTNPIISDNTTYNPSSKRPHSKDIYSKQMALKLKTEMKLDEIRKRNHEEEMKHLQQKPIINTKSKQICKKNGKTFLERLNEEQNKKLINQQHKLINNNKPPLPKKQIRSKEEFDKWIEKNEKWNHERKIKIEHLKNAIQILEDDSEDLTFCPTINKNSKCIVEEKGQIPINERIEGIIETKNSYVKRKQQEILPSFTPRINTSYKISEEYYDFMKDDQEEIYNSLRRE